MMGELPFCKAGKPSDMDACANLDAQSDPPGASESCVTSAGTCGSDGTVCSGESGTGEETCGAGIVTPNTGCSCGDDGSGDDTGGHSGTTTSPPTTSFPPTSSPPPAFWNMTSPTWGSSLYTHCLLNLTMQDMSKSQESDTPVTFATGGLGHLLVEDVYEAWVCVAHHACSDPLHEVRLPTCSFASVSLLRQDKWSGVGRPWFADVGMRACVHVIF